MDDVELLDLAAKAYASQDIKKLNFGAWFNGARGVYWNPLADDGDALRLAVKLKIAFFPPENDEGDFAVASIAEGVLSDDGDAWIQEWVKGGDKLAATRRAIVCAAAEIGRANINDLTPGEPSSNP